MVGKLSLLVTPFNETGLREPQSCSQRRAVCGPPADFLKGRFSECADAVGDDEDGCGSEQREHDPPQPVLPSIQAVKQRAVGTPQFPLLSPRSRADRRQNSTPILSLFFGLEAAVLAIVLEAVVRIGRCASAGRR